MLACQPYKALAGSGVFACGDVAGAKAVLALVRSLVTEGRIRDYAIVTRHDYDFAGDFGLEITPITTEHSMDWIKSRSPDFIFTGTSHPNYSTIENRAIRFGLRHGIKTYSFIDHWTGFRLRFRFDDTIVYPDEIWVIDEAARELALAEDLPGEKIKVAGNPYYEYLRGWTPSATRETFLRSIDISREPGKILVYAPDPLSSPLDLCDYGFDEVGVLRDLLSVIEDLDMEDRLALLIKPHPKQDVSGFVSYIQSNRKRCNYVRLLAKVHTNTLLYYSDLVIGFFSNLLIEAACLGANVIRYLPGSTRDPMYDLITAGKRVDSRAELKDQLQTALAGN